VCVCAWVRWVGVLRLCNIEKNLVCNIEKNLDVARQIYLDNNAPPVELCQSNKIFWILIAFLCYHVSVG